MCYSTGVNDVKYVTLLERRKGDELTK